MSRVLFAIPLLASLTSCGTDPPAPKPIVTEDLRPAINRAFRRHNSQTTESLRALSNSYEANIPASNPKHPLAPGKDLTK